MKRKAIIFGAGKKYEYWKNAVKLHYEVSAIIDNDEKKQGTVIDGLTVYSLDEIENLIYSVIIVTPEKNRTIIHQLLEIGVSEACIVTLEDAFEHIYDDCSLEIAMIFQGGMGDFLIEKNWLKHLTNKYGLENYKIVIYVEENSYQTSLDIFANGESIYEIRTVEKNEKEIQSDFDLVIKFCIVPYVVYLNEEKIWHINSELYNYTRRLVEFGLENYNIGFCDSPTYYKTIRKIFDKFPQKNYYSFCDMFGDLNITEDYTISIEPQIDADAYLKRLGLNKKKYLTINTGANMTLTNGGNTRIWSHEKWNELSARLRKRYKTIDIVQVGFKISDDDDIEADFNLNGKTDFEEIKVLLKYALLHVDYDGGLVHVRHILRGGISTVLFGSSGIEQHLYSENINIRSDVCKNPCEWTSREWLSKCPQGYDIPICMKSLTVETVFESICDYIDGILYEV